MPHPLPTGGVGLHCEATPTALGGLGREEREVDDPLGEIFAARGGSMGLRGAKPLEPSGPLG